MKRFAQLFEALDATTSTNAKVEAMVDYFQQADHRDAAWAVFFLSGRRIKRLLGRARLTEWLIEASGYEEWLVNECYSAVGDFAETLSLLMDGRTSPRDELPELSLAAWMDERILPLADQEPGAQRESLQSWWMRLPRNTCFMVTKLLTGGLRVGVSQLLLARALASLSGNPRTLILHRLTGNYHPSPEHFARLIDPKATDDDVSQPYPFFLASPIEKEPAHLGPIADWLAEWKWDGIRAQLIRRSGQTFIWSRGEELVTERFPEVALAAGGLPNGTVIDGELLAWNNGVLPFSALQRRLNRKTVSKKLLQEVPVRLQGYDCLELDGRDLRKESTEFRRAVLERLVAASPSEALGLSPLVDAANWDALRALRRGARERGVEGIMLKRRDAPYRTGRQRGDWWKWKVDPLSIDAVMIYAQAGHGRRATLFTDYTFAVWSQGKLLPLAKAYSGLSDSEIASLDRWIRANTTERFGPVRAVKPEQVFEIAFEGINLSKRHKSGVALRFPRIARWRKDKTPQQADQLEDVKRLISRYEAARVD